MTRDDWQTESEIAAQPAIWRSWASKLPRIAAEIRTWVEQRKPDEIWLCGAGSSAFIGDAIAVSVNGCRRGIPVVAIASTDLVAYPGDYFKQCKRPLVVSFGRSGNSSESIGTLNLLDQYAPDADRLSITCNAESALARSHTASAGEQRIIVLPDECHDKSFAMTSSFTTMLLTAIACLDDKPVEQIEGLLQKLAAGADALLGIDLAPARPARVVFLGSGPFKGAARESALKVLELTAGRVVTSWDSTLGFRHGPKAIMDDETTVIVFLSAQSLARKYDRDVVDEIRSQFPRSKVTTIGSNIDGATPADIEIVGADDDLWNVVLCMIISQRLSVQWSKSLSLNVDNPFTNGNLTRVVSGVRLYA